MVYEQVSIHNAKLVASYAKTCSIAISMESIGARKGDGVISWWHKYSIKMFYVTIAYRMYKNSRRKWHHALLYSPF